MRACAREAPQTGQTDKPAAAIGEREPNRQTVEPAAREVCKTLWPPPRILGTIRDRRDQRLIYRLAVLSLSEIHGGWVRRLLAETAEARPKNALAWLQAHAPDFAPDGCHVERLLRSIPVPAYALADVRHWNDAKGAP